MSTPTPQPPPPPPWKPTPTPPPPPPPSPMAAPGDYSIDMSPTGTVPVYKTEKMGAVPGSAPVDDRYGFEIADDETAPPIAPVGRDADGDGIDDSVQEAQEAEAAQIASQAADEAKKKKSKRGPAGVRRGTRLWVNLVAIFGPLLLMMTSCLFITSAFKDPNASPSQSNSDGDDSESTESQASDDGESSSSGDVQVAPVPDVVIGAEGDPLRRAIQLAENHAILRSEDSPLPSQIILVRSDIVGPDSYALRLVVIRYLGSSDNPTAKIACVDWDANVASQEITERGETSLGDEEEGRVDLAVRELELRAACEAASVG